MQWALQCAESRIGRGSEQTRHSMDPSATRRHREGTGIWALFESEEQHEIHIELDEGDRVLADLREK